MCCAGVVSAFWAGENFPNAVRALLIFHIASILHSEGARFLWRIFNVQIHYVSMKCFLSFFAALRRRELKPFSIYWKVFRRQQLEAPAKFALEHKTIKM